MWSLTSQRERRTSGPENFQSQAKKDFFNTIRHKRSYRLSSWQLTLTRSRRPSRGIMGDRPKAIEVQATIAHPRAALRHIIRYWRRRRPWHRHHPALSRPLSEGSDTMTTISAKSDV